MTINDTALRLIDSTAHLVWQAANARHDLDAFPEHAEFLQDEADDLDHLIGKRVSQIAQQRGLRGLRRRAFLRRAFAAVVDLDRALRALIELDPEDAPDAEAAAIRLRRVLAGY